VDTDAAAPLTATVEARPRNSDQLTLFAITWAAATLFHVWGRSGRITDIITNWTTTSALQALAGAVAIWVLVRPRNRLPLLVLAALGPLIAWFEAPLLGNHWLVVAFVDLAIVLAFVAARGGARFDKMLITLARWTLIIFYSFAAFAKLNHAFFTPNVSCATYYLDELARSMHLTLDSQNGGAWANLVPLGVAAIELSVPVLLLVRRTRHIGVLVGLVFHGVIAVDQTHLFADFSSVLDALFLLFLPAAFATYVFGQVRQLTSEGQERLRALVILGAAILLAMQLYGRSEQVARFFFDGQGWAWVSYDVALVVLVIGFVRATHPAPIEHPLAFGAAGLPVWLAILPALVILNGLSPYLELRTAYGFNMYANLRTADGESNHLLITRTLPLTDVQSDLVRITATSDPGLRLYVGSGFEIPFLQFHDYMSRHRDASVTYVRNGVEHRLARADEDPEVVRPVPSWESKLLAFRALDDTGPSRCQPGILPAL
jgi:hypothetical protein